MTTEAQRQNVFKLVKIATNMPFCDGSTLAFGQSTGAIKQSIPTTGDIWKRVQHNKALAERMKNLPRAQDVTYRPWKLAYCSLADKVVKRVLTGFAEGIVERCPSFYQEGDQVHFSFVSGVPTSAGFFYQLFSCSGPSLAELSPPELISPKPTFFGFVSPHHICSGMMNVIHLTEKATQNSFKLKVGLHRVSNVTYVSNEPAKLLITGLVDRSFKHQTVLHDLSTGATSDVTVDGAPLYKSTLFGDSAIFAEKSDAEFEHRQLCQGTYTLQPSNVQISKE